MKLFDLNIEKVLEDWETHHGIREIISNALDEQILTSTKDIEIHRDSAGLWHIKDFGRGVKYEHLTQKENQEKLKHPNLIGKFGVGLKDALAVFDRRGVVVTIKSRHSEIQLERVLKHGFSDVVTLHARILPPTKPRMVGTDVTLEGCPAESIAEAKALFLKFSGAETLESTAFGDVLARRPGTPAQIYVNGVKVAAEDNFLCSYNITALNASIKKAMNRERTNVGRSAYTDRVRSILLAANTRSVAEALVNDLARFETGMLHDELKWTDVAVHAAKLLNAQAKVLFLSPSEMMNGGDYVDDARASGFRIIVIPDNVRDKIVGQNDVSGKPMRDLSQFKNELNQSFQFKFLDPVDLTESEQRVFSWTSAIFDIVGGRPPRVARVLISETMRKESFAFVEAVGLWKPPDIIVKRTELRTLQAYASTLLHEVAHAISGAPDISRRFEEELTELLGKAAAKACLLSETRDAPAVVPLPVSVPRPKKTSKKLNHRRKTTTSSKGTPKRGQQSKAGAPRKASSSLR